MSNMMHQMSTQELQLCDFLKTLPRAHNNQYTEQAEKELLQSLFWSLAGGRQEYLRLFFPDNTRPPPNAIWKLRKAQGGADGDEFTEAARGKACGHIFKSGEATYRCKTCSTDDTCVLCSRCYDSSDHTGHMIYISVSSGNSGCCDCGDPEAWRLPVHCSIHTAHDESIKKEKGKAASLPDELVESIRMTIGRVFDYVCDVISCSPEQLRLPKSRESILQDEKMSRLGSKYYNGDIAEEPCTFALLLWNDEKHTINEVCNQVSKACRVSKADAMKRALETDDIGRSIVKYSSDVDELLRVSKIIEQIKVTATIRSARDTFREQMCGTVIEWLSDIAGCSVGPDHDILRRIVCEEMLKPWSTGSEASNSGVGMKGIDDHERDEHDDFRRLLISQQEDILRQTAEAIAGTEEDTDNDDGDGNSPDIEVEVELMEDEGSMSTDAEDEDDSFDTRLMGAAGGRFQREGQQDTDTDGDIDMTQNEDEDPLEMREAVLAGWPPPPPPPPRPAQRPIRDRDLTPSDSDTAEMQPLISHNVYAKANIDIPKTPKNNLPEKSAKPARYWLETPQEFRERDSTATHEDLWQRLRLDWLILFDLRMWKKVRVDLRDLYISTVVSIPQFKRILGLRFAGLYTTLAELYLIADREPDHSIINISLQMLTTPSITAEIVERGNFLTNLMAILYTFLTTRQVGHPHDIFPNAVLAFDSGSVTNRRMYHFFVDLRYLFNSEHVQERLRVDERYMMQFLDLVKLHQGICPNVRAVGEHVEYETDAWISASLITREINRLCRQFSESFKCNDNGDLTYISKAIRLAAKTVILNSLGAERKHFTQAEIKDEIRFKKVGDYEFDTTEMSNSVLQHSVIKFVVESQPISFHHALHYTLSWLIECGKSMTRQQLTQLLSFTTEDLMQKPKGMGQRTMPSQSYTPEDHLMAVFDYPLRVCAWLAQMKAGIWVRNGMSLRHQQGTYRGVQQRDVSHHRDIFLLQTAMVVCPPARVLVSIIDRYGLEQWMKGTYEQKSDALDDGQVLEIVEELIHLLIILVSDRTSLVSTAEEASPHVLAMRRDIIHVLCFKPLSFSEICSKLPDKFQDQEECEDILDEMTTFKPPDGLTDVGTFELKDRFLEGIDPYIAHYNKNQREESENAYKEWMAKETGRNASDIVFEPKLRLIESGAFSDLAAFTRTGIFAQIIYYSLLYPLRAEESTPTVPVTRIEAFLQVVLHLVLIAIAEDKTDEDEMSEASLQSFVYMALTSTAKSNFIPNAPGSKTIAGLLEMLSQKEAFKSCHAKITLVLKRMKQKHPRDFEIAFARLGVPVDRISTASPANSNVQEEREKKKQAALDRQARVMAKFQQQQKEFLNNQGDIDWGEDEMEDENADYNDQDHKTYYQYPAGKCILCQEETGKDGRLYGTFALMTKSTILRQTDFENSNFIREVSKTPVNLDRSAESLRPFGVAGENREEVHKVTSSGVEIVTERQSIGRGFPSKSTRPGPVSVGCGHIMHYKCFEVYYDASHRRHQHQIARHHPERLEVNEFVCPLCKALGNAFLPIIWPPKEEVYPGPLQVQSFSSFLEWLESFANVFGEDGRVRQDRIDAKLPSGTTNRSLTLFLQNTNESIVAPLAAKISELLIDAWNPSTPGISRLFTTAHLSAPLAAIANAALAERLDSGSSHADDNNASDSASPASSMKDLVDIYRRLRDTMTINELPTSHSTMLLDSSDNISPNDFCASDTLAQSLGFSISAVEIQQRGVGAPIGTTYLETIPQQTVIHLRILAETAASYVSIGGIKSAGDNRVSREFCQDYERQYYQLFLNDPYRAKSWKSLNDKVEPLLSQDIFVFLTECSLCLAPVDEIDIMNIVRLCYLAEMVKVIIRLRHVADDKNWDTFTSDEARKPTSLAVFCGFCERVWRGDGQDGREGTPYNKFGLRGMEFCRDFVQKYALAFLRKVVLLLHVRYGVAFQNQVCVAPGGTELERLTEALRLPSFDDICSHIPDTDARLSTSVLMDWWIEHNREYNNSNRFDTGYDHSRRINVGHPAIFELIGLPRNYDILMEETMKRRCPTTGKDISDPMLCLFCAEIFCGQSICCLKEGPARPGRRAQNIGGAQQHMLK